MAGGDPIPDVPISQQTAWAAIGLIVVFAEDNAGLAGARDDGEAKADARKTLEGMMLDNLLRADSRPGGVWRS